MQCKKALSILLFSITMLSSLNAGWSDRWVSIKNYFSGFLKKPSLSRKNLVVGGVGALAIAGAIAGAVWWYNQPASKKMKKAVEKLLEKPRAANRRSFESLNGKEKKGGSVPQEKEMTPNEEELNVDTVVTLKDTSRSNIQYHSIKGLMIVREKVSDYLTVELFSKRRNETLLETDKEDEFQEVSLQPVANQSLHVDQEVIVQLQTQENRLVKVIGKVASQNKNEIKVRYSSGFLNIEESTEWFDRKSVLIEREKWFDRKSVLINREQE